jgi:predicted RNase H-like HicB family nuclease
LTKYIPLIYNRRKEEYKKGSCMRFGISGKVYEINRDNIINATKGIPPKVFDGRNRYYVELHGLRYPIKQPIHLVTGLPYTGLFGAQDAKRILKKLGFTVYSLHDLDRIEQVRSITTSTAIIDGTKKFAITLEQDEDGFIVASCPALPGCHSQGRTEEDTIANIREAIRGYIASMRRHGETIPSITEVREVEVAV